MSDLRRAIQEALNTYSAENGSNTPDYILADYLVACLKAFDEAVLARSVWYGHHDSPGGRSRSVEEVPNWGTPSHSLERVVNRDYR